jgi:hypothetical protein
VDVDLSAGGGIEPSRRSATARHDQAMRFAAFHNGQLEVLTEGGLCNR